MNKRLGVRSEQVGEGNDASLPTATDLEALQEGLKEGLDGGPTVESNPQDTTNEPVVTPRIEDTIEDTIVVHTPQPSTPTQDDRMDTPDEELEGTHSNTNDDTEMPEVTTQSDLPPDISMSDQMEYIVAPPQVPAATRIPSWKRELTASTAERDRVQTSYGLRAKPAKKSLFY